MKSKNPPLCASCAVRPFNLCGILGDAILAPDWGLRKEFRTVKARQNLYRVGERTDQAVVMCDGWAFGYHVLSDGRRQILSFILPGDLIAAHMVFREKLACSIEMLTHGRVCHIDRRQLAAHLQSNQQAFDHIVDLCISETEEKYDVLADLGRRRAEERIARLILRLRNRLAERDQVWGEVFPFPLRQQHIADAVGLTPIHVNRVLGLFRRTGLIELSKQTVRILDMMRLSRIADMNCERPASHGPAPAEDLVA